MPALSGGTMRYVSRSAKSTACSKLKVVGVRRSFFLPRRIERRTSFEEFHSVKKTLRPCATSQRYSSVIWVDLPEPSMPSTTMSLPGYGCASVSITRLVRGHELIVDGHAEQRFEQPDP